MGVGRGGLRPLGVGETLDTAMGVYRRGAIQLWQAVAIVVIPLEFVELLLRRASLGSDVFVHNGTLYTNSLSGSTGGLGITLLILLIGILAQLLATGVVFKLVLDGYLGRPTDISESFAFASGKVLSLLWLSILIGVLTFVGLILIVIPGIWFLVSSSVAIPVLMMEGLGGFGAIRRSFDLVRGRWWATLGRLVAAFILVIVAEFVIGLITGGVTAALGVSNLTLFLIVNAILAALVTILVSPFTAAVLTVIYIDLRVRKEALDIELLVGGHSPAGPARFEGEGGSSSGFSTPPPGG